MNKTWWFSHIRKPGSGASIWTPLLLVVCMLVGQQLAASEMYDHFQHGFDLDGAHRSVSCESCHKGGVFKTTPKECSLCHDGSGIYAVSARSINHISTTDYCGACHLNENWSAIKQVDHTEVFGTCTSCHNGQSAEGLPLGHIQTFQECNVCHTDLTWTAVIFDHSEITSACQNCHNGMDATGKSPMHILTTENCEGCHSTNFWSPEIAVDHTQVMGSCSSCHNGMVAMGKHAQHITSNDMCDDCHTTN
ncbi:MAG: hypothetical protein KUG75_13520, partial [Pseudomonadales bacterium]|nr:hypothetical protein [Pseudomonadales bacterium]